MDKPNFCPNCGHTLPEGDHGAQSLVGGYDCYCDTCGWSGDINPDDIERGLPNRLTVRLERESSTDPGAVWVVSVDEMPGVNTQGYSFGEALSMLKDATKLMLEETV